MLSEEDRSTVTINKYRKFDEVWTYIAFKMRADKPTDDTLCTSSFVDDVVLSHSWLYGKVLIHIALYCTVANGREVNSSENK